MLAAASLLAIHAPAVPGAAAATTTDVPKLTQRPFNPWWGLESRGGPGIASVPRYNQRKARKIARSSGGHPANAKRR
jgi:hypothetical protein